MTTKESEGKTQEENNQEIEILSEGYSTYDLSFKIIVIGNSGN